LSQRNGSELPSRSSRSRFWSSPAIWRISATRGSSSSDQHGYLGELGVTDVPASKALYHNSQIHCLGEDITSVQDLDKDDQLKEMAVDAFSASRAACTAIRKAVAKEGVLDKKGKAFLDPANPAHRILDSWKDVSRLASLASTKAVMLRKTATPISPRLLHQTELSLLARRAMEEREEREGFNDSTEMMSAQQLKAKRRMGKEGHPARAGALPRADAWEAGGTAGEVRAPRPGHRLCRLPRLRLRHRQQQS
jgi:hypothetical protein